MPSLGSTFTQQGSQLSAWKVMNFPIVAAATEYTLTLPAGTKAFLLQNRYDGHINIADTAGASGSTYFRVFAGDSYPIQGVNPDVTITVYIQSNKAAQVLEILYWT